LNFDGRCEEALDFDRAEGQLVRRERRTVKSEGQRVKDWPGGDRIRDRKQGQQQASSAQSYRFSAPVVLTQVVHHKQVAEMTIELPFIVPLPENP
jgi:hypothetical protein